MRFSRQEYWSGLPFPSQGDLPNPGIKPTSPAFAGRFFTAEPPRKPLDRCTWLLFPLGSKEIFNSTHNLFSSQSIWGESKREGEWEQLCSNQQGTFTLDYGWCGGGLQLCEMNPVIHPKSYISSNAINTASLQTGRLNTCCSGDIQVQGWRGHLPVQDMWVWSLDQEDPLEKGMSIHCSILAWKIPQMEEPPVLQSTRS